MVWMLWLLLTMVLCFGAIDFYKACKANGIKPIIGCEVYVAPRSRNDKDAELDSKYNHLILVVADAHNHEDNSTEYRCDYTHNITYNKSFSQVWDDIYVMIKRFKNIKIMFMPVSNQLLLRTAQIMYNALGSEIVDSAEVTTETNFVQVVTQTAITEYKRFIGIS